MIRYEKKESHSYAIGTTVTMELLLRRPKDARRVYIHPKMHRDETYHKIASLAKASNLPLIENNEKIFPALSGKDNVMAIGEFEKFENPLQKGNHLVLVNPSNQGNLGTIVRSALAFGIDGLAIITPAADIYDPKVIRGSMGAIFRLPFSLFSAYADYAKAFPNNAIYPFMLQSSSPLSEVDPRIPYSLVFGNEATGLDASFLALGNPVRIEQSDAVDSLNLDNAVSIGLYYFARKAK